MCHQHLSAILTAPAMFLWIVPMTMPSKYTVRYSKDIYGADSNAEKKRKCKMTMAQVRRVENTASSR